MNDPIVFSAEWFERHQGKLLWLLNHWLTRRWFRWVLRIRRCDIGYVRPMLKLLPHAYTVFVQEHAEGEVEVATDFRTHNKYAKRLYHALKPIWLLLHCWDSCLADRLSPKLSFGFATFTLTSLPDPSTGATTVDGYAAVTGQDTTFSNLRTLAGSTNSAVSVSLQVQLQASATSNQFTNLYRSIMTFDTSALPEQLVVASAVLSLFGKPRTTGLGSSDLDIAGATPASNNSIANGDYNQCQTTSFALIASGSWSEVGYNDFTLNAAGIANISLTGISRFSFQNHWDLANSFGGVWGSSATFSAPVASADTAGTDNDPKLVVTYVLAGGFTNQTNHLRPRSFGPGLAR